MAIPALNPVVKGEADSMFFIQVEATWADWMARQAPAGYLNAAGLEDESGYFARMGTVTTASLMDPRRFNTWAAPLDSIQSSLDRNLARYPSPPAGITGYACVGHFGQKGLFWGQNFFPLHIGQRLAAVSITAAMLWWARSMWRPPVNFPAVTSSIIAGLMDPIAHSGLSFSHKRLQELESFSTRGL